MSNIILDFDGTIHDCAKIYIPAFRTGYKYLTDNKYVEDREFTDNEIISYLGLSPRETWERIAPKLDKEICDTVTGVVYLHMKQLTNEGKSVLYEGAAQALASLKAEGHKLLFLSNCANNYMQLHRRQHNLDEYYTDFFCSEDYDYIPKSEIYKSICEKYPGEYIVVGDRFHDMEIAEKNNLKSIGCTYGYGSKDEFKNASVLISDISRLPAAVNSLV